LAVARTDIAVPSAASSRRVPNSEIARSSATPRPNSERNHGAMPVAPCIAASLTPRRRSAKIRHSRLSDGTRNALRRRSKSGQDADGPPDAVASHVISPAQSGSSASGPAPACSRPRSAFCIAAPNVRSIAMTSPVAFICDPRERSAVGNLSNGKRGNLTTT
jgi:hypothetical protein